MLIGGLRFMVHVHVCAAVVPHDGFLLPGDTRRTFLMPLAFANDRLRTISQIFIRRRSLSYQPTFTPREIRSNKRSFYGNLAARRHASSFSKIQRVKKISDATLFKEQDGWNANAQVHSKLFAAGRKTVAKSRLKREIPSVIIPVCTTEKLFLIGQYSDSGIAKVCHETSVFSGC